MPDLASPPVGIVGYGHFGRALGLMLDAAAIPFIVHDPAMSPGAPVPIAPTLDALAHAAGTIFVCVPVALLESALRGLRPALEPGHLVLDVGSVKAHPAEAMSRLLGREIPWCATHPLFGPAALARGERPLRAVVCPNDHHPGAHVLARSLYERIGCDVVEQSPESHDRLMAETHALAFFVAKAMLELDAGHGATFVPPSFRAMAQTIDTVRADAGHLFSVIQLANPYAQQARRRLLEAMGRIDAELNAATTWPPGGPRPDLDIAGG